MSVYLLLAVVAAVLWVMWRMFRWTFALIDYGRCRCRKEVEVFLTHTPSAYRVGQVVCRREGEPHYRITRILPQASTRLLNGGFVPCSSVRGVTHSRCPLHGWERA